MKKADQKAYAFARTICPHSTFKSGNSSLIAGWEIIEPKKRAGQFLRVSRLDDKQVNKIRLVLCKSENKAGLEKVEEFNLRPDRSGEYHFQSHQINLTNNQDGTVVIENLIAQEPSWKIKPIKLVNQI